MLTLLTQNNLRIYIPEEMTVLGRTFLPSEASIYMRSEV
jgi:hypothetical protein